jgi:AcrR family transcriptional regulator
MAAQVSQSLRVDAQDNRDRILEVARRLFAARGLEVTMREIARRAEVGVATLYRRFPTRESLVAAAFAEQMTRCAVVVDEALADPDPWHGFCSVIERVCTMQAMDRGFTAAFVSAFPDTVDFAERRTVAIRTVGELIRRAQESGDLRADFTLDDLVLVLMANGGIRADSPAEAVAATRRFTALLLPSLRAHPADPPAALPPGPPIGLHLLNQATRTGQ